MVEKWKRRRDIAVIVLVFIGVLAVAAALLIGLGMWLGTPGIISAMVIIYGVPVVFAFTDWSKPKHG